MGGRRGEGVLYAAYQVATEEPWINRRRCVGGREDPAHHTHTPHTHGAAPEISCSLCDKAAQRRAALSQPQRSSATLI